MLTQADKFENMFNVVITPTESESDIYEAFRLCLDTFIDSGNVVFCGGYKEGTTTDNGPFTVYLLFTDTSIAKLVAKNTTTGSILRMQKYSEYPTYDHFRSIVEELLTPTLNLETGGMLYENPELIQALYKKQLH